MPGLRPRRDVSRSSLVGAITWAKVIVPKRSSRVRQASSAAGTAAGSIPLAGFRRALEMIEGRQPGGSALAGDHRDALVLGVVDQDRHFAAETERPRVGDAQGQDRRGAGVRRVSARLEDLEPRGHGARPPAATAPCLPTAFQSVRSAIAALPGLGLGWGRNFLGLDTEQAHQEAKPNDEQHHATIIVRAPHSKDSHAESREFFAISKLVA